MAYKNNIPQGNDLIKTSAGDMRENFTQIFNVFGVNHEQFNTANAGMHKFLQMPEQGAPPVTGADEGALFAALGAYTNQTELMYRLQNNGAVLQLTQSLANVTAVGPGYAYIGGILIKWGSTSAAAAPAGAYTVSFPVAANIPVFASTPALFTQDTGTLPERTFNVAGFITTTNFVIDKIVTFAPINVRFLAIGT